jgi:protein SCO1/2
MRARSMTRHLFCLITLCAVGAAPVAAQITAEHGPALLRDIGFDQRLNTRVPLDLAFRDDTGRSVHLREYLGARPVILAFVYYECPRLCSLVLNGLLRSLRALSFNVGREFTVVTLSFDPQETPVAAQAKKEAIIQRYARPGAADGWHFLTGDEGSIRQLADAVGFRYTYSPESRQYAHATGLVILTPQGRISRYLYGLEYSPKDLRLALVEASTNTIGSAVDQVLLYCYEYDPAAGRYGVVIMNVIRLAGLATVLAVGTFVAVMFRLDRRHRRSTFHGSV